MRLQPQVRLACWARDHAPGYRVAQLSPEDIARARLPHGGNPVARWAAGSLPPGIRVSDRVVPGEAGDRLPARVYTPVAPASGPRPLVVRFHGGGWVLGNPRSADWFCGGVAAGADAVVVSVGYRKAPEHRAPAAALDAVAATRHLAAHAAELGADPDRVAVMGESAGGNLAAVVAQQVRDGGPRLAAQVLIYPGTDATLASESVYRLEEAPALSREDIETYLALYLGPHGDPTDPLISPLHAPDLSGLPPTLIQTAEQDPLVDDGDRYAKAVRAAGGDVQYTCYLGVPHGWVAMPRLTRVAPQALQEVTGFLAGEFSRPRPVPAG